MHHGPPSPAEPNSLDGKETTGLDTVGSSLEVKGRGMLVKEGGRRRGMHAVEDQSWVEGRRLGES